jgi:hypothetical protein
MQMSADKTGKHRRAKLKDVLALKSKLDTQQAAPEALGPLTANPSLDSYCLGN